MLTTEHPCKICGRPATFNTCDVCWENFVRETADRISEAIARREEIPDGC